MARGRRDPAPAGRRRQVLQIGSLSRHQPRENNPRSTDARETAGPSSKASVPAQGQGFSLLGAYEASGSEDEGSEQINDQVKDFLKELHVDDSTTPTVSHASPAAASATPSNASTAAEPSSMWHECLDPNSGHVYYWNTITNEVSWTRPEDFYASVAPAAVASPVAATHGEQAGSGNAATGIASAAVLSSADGHSVNGGYAADDGEHVLTDDDSDCNIENYDDDDDDGNNGDAAAASGHVVSEMERAFPTVSIGLVEPETSLCCATTVGCDDDINFEHHDSDDDVNFEHHDSDDDINFEHHDSDDDINVEHHDSDDEEESASVASSAHPASPRSGGDPTSGNAPIQPEDASNGGGSDVVTRPLCAAADSPSPSCPHSPLRSLTPVASDCEDLQATADRTCEIDVVCGVDVNSEDDEEEADGVAEKPDSRRLLIAAVTEPAPREEQAGLGDLMFADPQGADAFGFQHGSAHAGSPGPASCDGRAEKSLSKLPSATLALKPRSVARVDVRKGAAAALAKEDPGVSDGKAAAAVNDDDEQQQQPASMLDIFADDGSVPKEEGEVSSSASSPGESASQASPASSPDDFGDFDIDAALEESLENARSKSDKRPHESTSDTGSSDGDVDAEVTDGLQPAPKRTKPAPADMPVTCKAATASVLLPSAVSDMDLTAESETEMDISAAADASCDLADQPGDGGSRNPDVPSDTIGDQLLTLASELASKLKFLNITTNDFSNLHLALVRAETRLADWQAGALDGSYAVRMLQSSVADLHNYERACAPPGWQCLWDSSAARYYYHDTSSGETRWDYPSESAKLAPQHSYNVAHGLHQATAAMFAGAMAATYQGYIYGNYQGAYMTAMPAAAPMPIVSTQTTYSAPPLPADEPPPPPPGVDDPPPPSNPPPPPPPPDDCEHPTPTGSPPPLPSEVGSPGLPPPEMGEETSGESGLKGTSTAIVIQAAAAITKRPAPVEAPPPEPSIEEAVLKASMDDPLQTRMRATLLARGMSEADINDYFVQEALKQQQQQQQLSTDSQPGSPRASGRLKKDKKKKEKAKNMSSGIVPKKKKNMTELVSKWSSIRQQEREEEKADSEEDDPVRMQQRKIQEWKATQLSGGGAHSNPNFEEVSGDWRDRVKRSKR